MNTKQKNTLYMIGTLLLVPSYLIASYYLGKEILIRKFLKDQKIIQGEKLDKEQLIFLKKQLRKLRVDDIVPLYKYYKGIKDKVSPTVIDALLKKLQKAGTLEKADFSMIISP